MRRVLALLAVGLAATLASLTSPDGRADTVPPLTSFGQLATPVAGVRPLLTVLLDFSDVGFSRQHDAEFYRRLLFRDGANIARFDGFMGAMSGERFSFASAGVVGPYRLADDPASPADESTIACIINGEGCSTTDGTSRASAIRSAAAGGFDFGRYDRNGDGNVTGDELGVLMVVASPEGDGVYTTTTNPLGERLIGWASETAGPGLVHLERFQHPLSGDLVDVVRSSDGRRPPAGYERFTIAEGNWIHGSAGPGRAELNLYYSASRMDYTAGTAPPPAPDDGRPADYSLAGPAGGWVDTASPGAGAVALQESYRYGDAGTWGAVRGTNPGCVPAGRVSVCLRVPAVGEAVGAETLAHELAHSIGVVWEAYGSSCRSQDFTIMTCTGKRGADLRSIVGLDPYARMHLGWAQPRVLPVSARGCYDLSAAATPRTPGAAPEAYILYDPARGTDELIMLEYRWRRPGSYDANPFRAPTTTLPDEGLAVWLIRKSLDSGWPLNIPAYDAPPPAQDNAVFLVPPDPGTLGEPVRRDGLWSGSSEIRPRFMDGTATGVVIRLAAFEPGDRTIRFGLNQLCVPLRNIPSDAQPTFDRCRATANLDTCTLDGPLFTATRRTSATTDPGSVGTVSWTLKPKRPLAGKLQIQQPSSNAVTPRAKTLVARFKGRKTVVVRTTFTVGETAGVAELGALLRYLPARGEPRWRKKVAGTVTIAQPWPFPGTAEARQLLGPPVAPPLPPTPPPGPPQPTPSPDLVINGLIKTSATVKNSGNANAGAYVLTISVNGTVVKTFGANGLTAGSSETFAFGACYVGKITAVADATGAVTESNEGNNGAEITNAKCP